MSRSESLLLTCIIPAYNEEGHIVEFLKQLRKAVDLLTNHSEIIVINDGSNDSTGLLIEQVAPQLKLRYLQFSRNFGKEAAISAGIDVAKGNAVVIMDSDFQHPLNLLPSLVAKWREGYDMVYTVIASRTNENLLKRWGTKGFYWILNKSSRIPIPSNAGDFRLMDEKVVKALRQMTEKVRFMKGLYAWVGYKSIGIGYMPDKRTTGKSSYSLYRLFILALDGITSFSSIPLRVWTWFGSFLALTSIIYGLYIIVVTWIAGNGLPGWPTLAAGMMLLAGVQLISIGVLGEYLGRIYDEVKRRPLYIIADELDYSDENEVQQS
ncbi:MAG: glycosyltransferase family 2 protein [Gammaproteobacteria bacterium]|nr:glycosyltransferase family 2 protein [Gammaproteobacteria bacterium]